ncbi:MAG: NAD(P)-dependent oxidoreductase [Roseiarcus sp.]
MAPMAEAAYDLRKLWLAADREAFLAETAPDVSAIATRGELGASAALIDRCPKLEIVACCGVGYDAIDIERAKQRGARVTNTPDVPTEDGADFAFALILAHLRKVVAGDAHVRSGAWARTEALPLGSSLRGKTVGILGFEVEVACSGIARAANMDHAYFADPLSRAKASDSLVAAVSGDEATHGIVNKAVLDALGPEGLFVNVSRGSVVDEPALVEALANGKIGGAALDVFWRVLSLDR